MVMLILCLSAMALGLGGLITWGVHIAMCAQHKRQEIKLRQQKIKKLFDKRKRRLYDKR